MREIIKADQPFVRSELARDQAPCVFADQPYKGEIIERVRESAANRGHRCRRRRWGRCRRHRQRVSQQPEFVRLCRGRTSLDRQARTLQTQKVAGVYWRGNEKGPMLQRIYGTAWETNAALQAHSTSLVEAEKRDHRRLANRADLFISERARRGPCGRAPEGGHRPQADGGLQPGARHIAGGYEFVYTPHLTNGKLFETSGHLAWYADGMYPPMEMDNRTYYPKPTELSDALSHLSVANNAATSKPTETSRLHNQSPVAALARQIKQCIGQFIGFV